MSSLVEAVRAVRDEVQAGEGLQAAVAFIAEEAGINPILLARKVSESYGSESQVANSQAGISKAPPAAKAEAKPRKPKREPSLEESFEEMAKMMGKGLEDIIPGYYAKAYPHIFAELNKVRPVSAEEFGREAARIGARKLDAAEASRAAMSEPQLAAVRAAQVEIEARRGMHMAAK